MLVHEQSLNCCKECQPLWDSRARPTKGVSSAKYRKQPRTCMSKSIILRKIRKKPGLNLEDFTFVLTIYNASEP